MELRIERLSVTLGKRAVLHDIDAVLRPGRITAILGPNGAGKSTLVKTAAALLTPSAGRVMLGDRDVVALPPRTCARAIGYLPQDGRVHWSLRVREVVALGRTAHRSPFAAPAATDDAAVAAALAATGTAPLADRDIDTLSGGELARVLLARALAGEPAWLLADEPLASLDPAHQIDLLERLRGVADAGRGVAIVLHDLLHAGRVADDVILLDAGRIVAAGEAASVLTPETIAAVFGIAVSVSRDDAGRLLCIPQGRLPHK